MKPPAVIRVALVLLLLVTGVSASQGTKNSFSGDGVLALSGTPGMSQELHGGGAVSPSSPGTSRNLSYSSDGTLSSRNGALIYNFSGISSENVRTIIIVPRIYRKNNWNDAIPTLVFEEREVTCTNTRVCMASGSFIPVWDIKNVTGAFFSNATILFTPYNEGD